MLKYPSYPVLDVIKTTNIEKVIEITTLTTIEQLNKPLAHE